MDRFTSEHQASWSSFKFWTDLGICVKTPTRRDGTRSKGCEGAARPGRRDGPVFTSTLEETVAATERQKRLNSQGFAIVEEKLCSTLVAQIRTEIFNLVSVGFPATFVLLSDTVWELAVKSRKILLQCAASTSNGSSPLQLHLDCLAWHITDHGFSPHRDRQPDHPERTFDEKSGNAAFITHWIALTDATPANSCLYMIPAQHDPGYKSGDEEDGVNGEKSDPLQRCLPSKQCYQRIRAIPLKSGQSVLFTHRIIHWGSARDTDDELSPPRMALSFTATDPAFESPFIQPDEFFVDDKDCGLVPPWELRLLLVCAQLIIYNQRMDCNQFSVANLLACHQYCKHFEDRLVDQFRTKVFTEFAKAVKERTVTCNVEVSNDSNNEDAEDAALEAMLDNDEEFSDDYDDEIEEEVANNILPTAEDSNDAQFDKEDLEGASLFGVKRRPPVVDATDDPKRLKFANDSK